MDNYRINEGIAKALNEFKEPPKRFKRNAEFVGDKLCYYDDRRVLHSCFKDYIDSWDDLMPLVVEYKISLDWDSFNWTAFQSEFHEDGEHLGCGYETTLIDPKRALAECLLRVLTTGE